MPDLSRVYQYWTFAPLVLRFPRTWVRPAVCSALAVVIALAALACGSDSPPVRERDDRDDRRADRATRIAGERSAGVGAASGDSASGRENPVGRTYVPQVLGAKVFAAQSMEDLKPYFSATGGRSLNADAMFDEADDAFRRLPQHEPLFQPDTPVIVTVVAFDCRPAGNIRLQGTTSLIDKSVPGAPSVRYERPFSIERRQTADGFSLSTSWGRGCMDNLNAGAPPDGWEPGQYSVEYRDSAGAVLAAIPFEVVGDAVSSVGAAAVPSDGQPPRAESSDVSRSSAPELWIDVNLEPLRPGVQIEVSSNVNIEAGDLLVTVRLKERNYFWGQDLRNRNRIAGGAGFVPMDFGPITWPMDGQWHATSLDTVFAAFRDGDLVCNHDVAASDQRRQHSFDDRDVYSCTPATDSSSDGRTHPNLILSGENVLVTPNGETITILPGGQPEVPLRPTDTPIPFGR